MTPLEGLMALFLLAGGPSADEAVQDLVVLGETRPILLRLHVTIGDKAFRTAWSESTRSLHARLDRNGDGKLTVAEMQAGGIGNPSTAPATAGTTPVARPAPEIDVNPKDGVVSVDELAVALLTTSGPFRVRADGSTGRRTDALFDQIDRDKDGQLTRSELSVLVGSLRRLDRDDDELIAATEVDLAGSDFSATMASTTMMGGRPARDPIVPPAFELIAGDTSLKPARLLLKKYDRGSARGPGRLDSKLSPEEFALPPAAFKALDRDGDGLLNVDELRGYLSDSPRDALVDVVFSPDTSGHATAKARAGAKSEGFSARPLADGTVEIDVGSTRVDLHVDDGAAEAMNARRNLRALFDAADNDESGYLDATEIGAAPNGQPSPLSVLFRALDRDGDAKVMPRELDEYVDREASAARGRLTLTASDEGRALFGILDTDRDRRLGAREVLGASARVSACDRDGDGRVAPEEIPHHVRLVLARGDLSGLLAPAPGVAVAAAQRAVVVMPPPRPTAGPAWFRRMDRNRDGDVSRREFLGTRVQFDHLDRDHDGLIGPAEAETPP